MDALRYAAAGLPIFPVRADKTPLTTHGVRDATTDVAKIEVWLRSGRTAILAWPCPRVWSWSTST